MKAGVFLDPWKLPIFQRHLAAAELRYEQHPSAVANTIFLTIETEDLAAVTLIIKAANDEAAATKKGAPDAN